MMYSMLILFEYVYCIAKMYTRTIIDDIPPVCAYIFSDEDSESNVNDEAKGKTPDTFICLSVLCIKIFS